MKIAYLYDGLTKEFLYETEAQESPLEPNVFLQPANSTYKIPPNVSVKQKAVYDTDADDWVVKDDYRGEIWYSAEGAIISVEDLGTPINLTKDKPPLTQEQLKQEIQAQLNGLEAKAYMRRGQREYWLATVTLQLQASNVTHEQAYAANPEYKRVYDENTQAIALRAQLKALE